MDKRSIRYLTPDQVAEILNCSRRTVYRLIESGALPVFRIGRKLLRINPAAVDEYIEEKIKDYEFESGFSCQ